MSAGLENDPSLWTIEGIAAAIPGQEWGAAIEWGAILLGSYDLPRDIDPQEPIARRVHSRDVWATLTVDEGEVRELLQADARRTLGSGKRYELRKQDPRNYGRTCGLAWYRCEDMDAEPKWGEKHLFKPKRMSGYLLVGQYVT